MKTPMSPGRLALAGIAVAVLGFVIALIFDSATNTGVWVVSLIAYGLGALLILGAGLAKVIQIGVRSADDR